MKGFKALFFMICLTANLFGQTIKLSNYKKEGEYYHLEFKYPISKITNKSENDLYLDAFNLAIPPKQSFEIPQGTTDLKVLSDSPHAKIDVEPLFFEFLTQAPYEPLPKSIQIYLSPYIMPESHPIKKKLDKIFTQSRPNATMESMKKAGFTHVRLQKISSVVFATHPEMKGFVFKLYLDTMEIPLEWQRLVRRVQGSIEVQKVIEKHHLNHLFKVPKKWLYEIPPNSPVPAGLERKYYVLVAEDMKILPNESNWIRWSSSAVSKEFLHAFLLMINEAGLLDSIHIGNVPFSTDKKVAFVDTEHFHEWPINYAKLEKYLNPKMAKYWREITQNIH